MAEIELTKQGAIARIVLNRPERKNALAGEMRQQLADAFANVNQDDEVRAVILTGAGDTFCAGADVTKMGQRDVKEARNNLQSGAHTLIRNLYNIEKPVIAAVRGATVGIGLSMMLGCDLVIASQTARFSCVFARRGLSPDSGTAYFLARLIGLARARELVFTTRFFSAEEAAAMDLVTQVVPDDQLEAAAQAMAESMAAQPTFALAMAKKMLQFSLSPSLDQFLDYESLIQPLVRQTRDFQEGVDSFKEKRPAQFVGR